MSRRTIRYIAIAGVIAAVCWISLLGCASVSGGAQTACEVVDASKSTRFVQPQYAEALEGEAEAIAGKGGSLVVVVVTGDPGVEAIPEEVDFGNLTGVEKEGQRISAVRELLEEVEAKVRASALGRENPSQGSGIVEGINLLGDRGDCSSVSALSDGLETSAFHTHDSRIGSATNRRHLIDELRARHLVPKLEGELDFPFGGVLPQGTNLSPAVLAGVREFWSLYAEAAGVELRWRVSK